MHESGIDLHPRPGSIGRCLYIKFTFPIYLPSIKHLLWPNEAFSLRLALSIQWSKKCYPSLLDKIVDFLLTFFGVEAGDVLLKFCGVLNIQGIDPWWLDICSCKWDKDFAPLEKLLLLCFLILIELQVQALDDQWQSTIWVFVWNRLQSQKFILPNWKINIDSSLDDGALELILNFVASASWKHYIDMFG